MKKYKKTINIIFLLWGIVLLVISEFFKDYVRSYLYLSIAVIMPFVIFDIIKQIKKFKTEGTKEIYSSINRMMIMAVVLIIIFAITKQNPI